ncbi:pyrophosphatase [Lampropedia cohaerens]|uniref:Inorganic pyrophosphatase n=1 Tax=Lampropedia cohaerens TaxID=1610491 RepID=A0A0U1PYI4_9BURK|nr:inorganic diphosphatase [Lampropedia cohaerens]KKW67531.1 pyrophosphatase [Lampropedia cohaerens]
MKRPIAAIAAAILTLGSAAALAEPGSISHPFHVSQPENAPAEVLMAVEIPAGSYTKYEIDEKTGLVFVDRFQSMPVIYPANYGSLSSTLGGDNDPLDGLVFTREPLHPGVMIKFRPIGYLKMIDGGKADEKIIGVPTSDVDPTYDAIQDISDLPVVERERIEAYFRVYKQLPAGRKEVQLNGYGNAQEAREMVRQAITAYQQRAARP